MVAGVALLSGLWLFRGRSQITGSTVNFAARRGPLDISVIEGGSVQALESQDVKCEVRGYQGTKILKIIEEGYQVTEEDIRTNKVLVELDSSDLQKQIVQQEIQYEQASASLIDAQQNYEIQLNQNLADVRAAEQKMRFARLDFDKFLGDSVTQAIIDGLGLDAELAEAQSNAREKSTALLAESSDGNGPKRTENAKPASEQSNDPASKAAATNVAVGPVLPTMLTSTNPAPLLVDFSKYARIEALGDGEAKQKLRKLEDDFQVAQKEQGQAQATLEGTKRLYDKGFVTRIDLQRDEIAGDNSRLKVQTAETARALFLKYEFPKSAEEALSKYTDAVRELARVKKSSISKQAQAEAKLKSAQGQFTIQSRQCKDLYEQRDKCLITAKKPGLVVYGSGGEQFFGNEERIREGATLRERQPIITIPNMTKMSVQVKIHESAIKKVKKGQLARITVDAFADKVLTGEVTKVGVLPDSANRWLNPDLKVYLTTITVNGTNEWLKPGMSAKVEIIVAHLDNVVYVPIQAVSPWEGKQVCYLASAKPERRVVEVGEFNDEFIEIKNGLTPGTPVLLRPETTSSGAESAESKAKPPAPEEPPKSKAKK